MTKPVRWMSQEWRRVRVVIGTVVMAVGEMKVVHKIGLDEYGD